MKSPYIGQLAECILQNKNVYRATKYFSPKLVAKATRRHKYDGRSSRTEVVITFGAPNFSEREFIKRCRKSDFPVKKIQLKAAPKRK